MNFIADLHGVIHGTTIELQGATGLPEGQAVVVSVRPVRITDQGLRSSFGAWSDAGGEVDVWLEEMRVSRRRPRTEPA